MDIIQFFSDNPKFFLMVVAGLSLIIGSFLNVVIYRLPLMIEHEWSQECRQYLGLKPNEKDTKSLTLSFPNSHCTHCKKPLKPWHNIPVISYLALKGKCAHCHVKIAPRYPFIEALTCIASVYVAWRFGLSYQTLSALFFTWTIIALTFIDLDCQLLPDGLNFMLLGAGLLGSLFGLFCNSQDAIIGMICGYLVFAITQSLFKLVTGKIGMGEGDYKFLAALGAYLGWQMLPIIIIFASVSGIVFSVAQMAMKQQFKSVPLPFGPYLAVAGWISLIWGNDILNGYLHVIHA